MSNVCTHTNAAFVCACACGLAIEQAKAARPQSAAFRIALKLTRARAHERHCARRARPFAARCIAWLCARRCKCCERRRCKRLAGLFKVDATAAMAKVKSIGRRRSSNTRASVTSRCVRCQSQRAQESSHKHIAALITLYDSSRAAKLLTVWRARADCTPIAFAARRSAKRKSVATRASCVRAYIARESRFAIPYTRMARATRQRVQAHATQKTTTTTTTAMMSTEADENDEDEDEDVSVQQNVHVGELHQQQQQQQLLLDQASDLCGNAAQRKAKQKQNISLHKQTHASSSGGGCGAHGATQIPDVVCETTTTTQCVVASRARLETHASKFTPAAQHDDEDEDDKWPRCVGQRARAHAHTHTRRA